MTAAQGPHRRALREAAMKIHAIASSLTDDADPARQAHASLLRVAARRCETSAAKLTVVETKLAIIQECALAESFPPDARRRASAAAMGLINAAARRHGADPFTGMRPSPPESTE